MTDPAVEPESAAGLAEAEQELRAAREHARRLAEMYRDRVVDDQPDSLVETVAGWDRVRQIRRSAQVQIRCLDKGYGDLHDPGDVHCRTVYDRSSIQAGRAAPGGRVLPEVPLSVVIVDDRCAVLPVGEGGAFVVVHRSSLLVALIDLFESLWLRSIPLDSPTTTQPDGHLVALLLSGLTDEAIARQVGLGHRTVQRRIAGLLADLGVRTRFQAGVQAAFREPGRTDG